MRVTEKYAIDKAHECAAVFGTTDPEHPGVRMGMQQGEVNLAGPVKVISDGGFKAKYGALFMTPAETSVSYERVRPNGGSRPKARRYFAPRCVRMKAAARCRESCAARSSARVRTSGGRKSKPRPTRGIARARRRTRARAPLARPLRERTGIPASLRALLGAASARGTRPGVWCLRHRQAALDNRRG